MKMDWTEKTWIVATCGRGCADVLKGELRAMGYDPQDVSPTSVGIEGDLRDAMRLNLWLRNALDTRYASTTTLIGGQRLVAPGAPRSLQLGLQFSL